ncbi:MAG: S8 family serine peptidase [Chloroflexi bacterium]|nr:S8 family serine peptidase [Chloroflexota bacterium]
MSCLRSWLARFVCVGLLALLIPFPTAPASQAQVDAPTQVAFAGVATPIGLAMPDGVPPYTHTIDRLPAHGTVESASGTVVLYTAAADYTGEDTLTYTITDATGASFSQQVTVAVFPAPEGMFSLPSAAQSESGIPSDAPQAVPNTYILHYVPGSSPAEIDALVAGRGGTVIDRIPALNAVVIALPGATEFAPLRDDEQVLALEPDLVRYPALSPNDPGLGSQWAFNNIHAYAAWDRTVGDPSVVIAVLDTGVDLDHPDLAGNLVAGYDFVDGDSVPMDSAGSSTGHGTHVAGIANARTNNGQGVAGMAWNARTMPVRIVSSGGATSSRIASGIVYATDNGANVINLSLGGPGWVKLERDAVNYAAARDVVIVASAGNDGNSTISYPASYDHVISVANTTETNERYATSNYNVYVDLAAPGTGIYSTLYDNTYGPKTGTSMAAPYVAGTAALVWSSGYTDTAREVRQALSCSAMDLGSAGRDAAFGWGLLQAHYAVLYDPAVYASCLPSVAHDDIDDARLVSPSNYTDTVNTRYATAWDDDPATCAGYGHRSVWYRYEGLADGVLEIDTGGSTYDTVLAVYTGERGSLMQIACNNDYSGTASALEVEVQTGETYTIMISSRTYESDYGTLTFNAHFQSYPPSGCFPSASNPAEVVCLSE